MMDEHCNLTVLTKYTMQHMAGAQAQPILDIGSQPNMHSKYFVLKIPAAPEAPPTKR